MDRTFLFFHLGYLVSVQEGKLFLCKMKRCKRMEPKAKGAPDMLSVFPSNYNKLTPNLHACTVPMSAESLTWLRLCLSLLLDLFLEKFEPGFK